MGNKLLIVSTNGKGDVGRATMAFHIANTAAVADREVMVFLMGEGVMLATKGYADDMLLEGFSPLKDLIDSYLAHSGTIKVCGTCAKARGVGPDDLIAGANLAGAINLVEYMEDGASTLTF